MPIIDVSRHALLGRSYSTVINDHRAGLLCHRCFHGDSRQPMLPLGMCYAGRCHAVRNNSRGRVSYCRIAPAALFLGTVYPWLATLCPDRRAVSHSQDELSCTFGDVSDEATLVGFTGDDVCIPADTSA